MRSDERDALVVPDAFEEGIFLSAACLEFLPRENGVVDFPPELPLEPPHGFRQGSVTWGANHQHIDVTGSILLVTREGPVQIRLLDSVNSLERLRKQGHR